MGAGDSFIHKVDLLRLYCSMEGYCLIFLRKEMYLREQKMITCLAFKNVLGVNVGTKGKFEMSGEKYSIKDIPFVRYKFDTYGDSELGFIKSVMKQFEVSGHIAEVNLGLFNTLDELTDCMGKLLEIEYLAVFTYADIRNSDVEARRLSDKQTQFIAAVRNNPKVRVCLRDCSNNLDTWVIDDITTQLKKEAGVKSEISICGSPLSFDGRACLTAVKARELAANCCLNFDAALPSSNHQSMNTCGCIRYMIVDKPIIGETAKTKTKDESLVNLKNKPAKKKLVGFRPF